jgi:hypothetical protein
MSGRLTRAGTPKTVTLFIRSRSRGEYRSQSIPGIVTGPGGVPGPVTRRDGSAAIVDSNGKKPENA